MISIDITFQRFNVLWLILLICLCSFFTFSQPVLPQRAITITPTQGINFGTFCIMGGSGGTVTVEYGGGRSATGDIALLTRTPEAQPAIFEIKLCQGRMITITFSSTTTLTGSNGGSLTMDIGPTEHGGNNSHFSTNSDCNFITPLRVGGTLHVPGMAIPGDYSGSLFITFNQQ